MSPCVTTAQLCAGAQILLKSRHEHEVERINIYQDRFLVAHTAQTLLLGDLQTCQLSEVSWETSGNEKYHFVNAQVSHVTLITMTMLQCMPAMARCLPKPAGEISCNDKYHFDNQQVSHMTLMTMTLLQLQCMPAKAWCLREVATETPGSEKCRFDSPQMRRMTLTEVQHMPVKAKCCLNPTESNRGMAGNPNIHHFESPQASHMSLVTLDLLWCQWVKQG